MLVRDDACAVLQSAEIADLSALLQRHFDGVCDAQVQQDLSNKSRIIRIFHAEQLVGFSTIAYDRLDWRGEEIGVVWSGDTIVDPEVWHASVLPSAWLGAVRRLHADRGKLAWSLICSGIRTWRFMTRCCVNYAPSPHADQTLVELRDYLATTRYGSLYHDGIVRLQSPQLLRSHLAEVPSHLAASPDAQLFNALNPGHQRGDELACAAWLSYDNLTRIGQHAWRRSDV